MAFYELFKILKNRQKYIIIMKTELMKRYHSLLVIKFIKNIKKEGRK